MARKKRPRVGTILGTEDRNDDDTIARTMPFPSPPPKPVASPETTLTEPAPRPEPASSASPVSPSGGDGVQGEGFSGKEALGEEDDTGKDTNTNTAAASPGGVPSLPDVPAPAKDLFAEVKDMLDQAAPTAPANATPTTSVTEQTTADYDVTPDHPFSDSTMNLSATDQMHESKESSPTGGASSGDPAGPGGAGDPQGAGNPGEGPGGVGGADSGAFDKGGPIKGKNPNVKGEIVTSTFKEGEHVMNVPATTILGKETLQKINRIAMMKQMSRAEKQRRVKRTIASAM